MLAFVHHDKLAVSIGCNAYYQVGAVVVDAVPAGMTIPKGSCLGVFWRYSFLILGVQHPTFSGTSHTTVLFRLHFRMSMLVEGAWRVSEHIF